MNNKFIILATIVGFIGGSYLPMIFGVSIFSLISVISGTLGGIIGLLLSFKFLNY